MLKRIEKRGVSKFLVVVLLVMLITIISQKYLNYQELVYNFYLEQLSQKQLEQLLKNQDKWSWIGYAIVPLIILIRTSLVSLCLNIGVFFYDTENKIKFKQFFGIALLGEFVLMSMNYFKFAYFYFLQREYTLIDLQQFYPLSYANFIDVTTLEPWLLYPIQTINLFEIGYFFVLVYGLHKLLKNKYAKSFEMVAISYGTGLVIWLGLIMFLTLNLT
jgi:hypothetical protein